MLRAATGLCMLWLIAAPAAAGPAAPCLTATPVPVGHGAASDPRSVRLSDGREVLLAGLEPLRHDSEHSAASRTALDALLKDRELGFVEVGTPDRYGRLSGFVTRLADGETLQEQLLKSGTFAAGLSGDTACSGWLRALEMQARKDRRGLWATSSATKNTEAPGDILAMMGRYVVAEGKVVSARQSGATFYVNFGRRWTRDFAVTVGRRDWPAFEQAGLSRLTLEGRQVRVRGWVSDQRGSPRIHAVWPAQIEFLP